MLFGICRLEIDLWGMDPKTLRALSNAMMLAMMGISAAYFYKTWQQEEPRWYFFILAVSIALLFSYNLLVKRKR